MKTKDKHKEENENKDKRITPWEVNSSPTIEIKSREGKKEDA
jgi:hypothetical protein